MSGSGGGGYVPPQRANFDCDTTIITTNVSSIDVNVLNNHNIGDILEIILAQNDALHLEDGNGEILGAILHQNTSDVVECIKSGAKYKAEIITINSPVCKVKISRL